jgi:CheY-like chemotaxis protein
MKQAPVILIVEDNPGDVRLIQEALKTSSIDPTLYFTRDGGEATHFLETRKHAPSHGFPHLIVLDLNLRQKSGFEVLEYVKRDEMLKRIPVIVLSSSQNPDDVAKAYDLHANCYLTKAPNYEAFVDVVKALEFFWTQTTNLP